MTAPASLRVLHVYAGNLYGGVEAMLSTMGAHRGLCPGLEPHFGLCFEGRLFRELRSRGAPVHLLGEARARTPWTIWRVRRSLARLLAAEPFDAVVCHSAWPQAVFGPVVRSARLPLAFWLYDPARGRHWIERWARRTPPDLALCNSRYLAATLPNLYPGVRMEIVYPPVVVPSAGFPAAERREARERLGTPSEAVVVVQASRLERWKGQAVHLEALGRLRATPGWVCWIVGGPQRAAEARYLEELKTSAARLGIADRVRFLGERSDVPLLLAAADVFCQPNTAPEPLGRVFVEALAQGKPVVASETGGVPEIVDGSCGILVPENDVERLAGALRSLLLEPASRARLGAAGPGRAEALCGVERQLARLRAVLEAAVSARESK